MSTEKRGSGGWFHSLKKAIQHTTHSDAAGNTSDPEFDVARENFTKLNDTVFRLRDKLNNYIQHAYGLFSNSNGAALDIASLLEDTSAPHPYSTIMPDVKLQHAKLVGDRESQLAHLMSEECLLKLDQEIELYKELNKRITIRNEMLSELDYYVNKVDSLKKERDEKLAKGKDEKPADVDKFERNIRKMEEKKNAFTAYNAGVVVDLTTCYRNRVLLLGPVLASFVRIEKELCGFYSEAMQGIRMVDEREAEMGLGRLRSSSQESAAVQLSEQQNTNPIVNSTALLAGARVRSGSTSSNNGSGSSTPMASNTTTIAAPVASPPMPSPMSSPPMHASTSTGPQMGMGQPPAPLYTSVPNPLSGMNNTPMGSVKSGDVEADKSFEKRRSVSSEMGSEGVSASGAGEKNPFESSLEAEKRNQAVFASPQID